MEQVRVINQKDVEKAKELARKYHKGQLYGNDDYFEAHLIPVYLMVKTYFPRRYDLQVMAFLHDIIEDTDCKPSEILAAFGRHVAYMVDLLTDELGPTRKLRKRYTYNKWLDQSVYGPIDWKIVKLCDRITNLNSGLNEGNVRMLATYAKEHDDFSAGMRLSTSFSYRSELRTAYEYVLSEAKIFIEVKCK
jgi:(p)ppGpp synthase/HD superfamily hydrolase